ncbi:ribosome biogenesis protein BRX1 [Nematocida minor]|uniref:ribosome biogenesis protein BRX1 n=1 Tax=Nematocida minor TaxID=1912983 RepID=UPI00221FF4A7|nr:ribosome biogenesis protein BRX1 [Nematocida minor]KAI5192036.1 ribosome biogenesis protein BRX1 [Nematocida minor]
MNHGTEAIQPHTETAQNETIPSDKDTSAVKSKLEQILKKTEIKEINCAPRKTLMLLSLKSPLTCRLLLNDLTSLLPENILRDSKLKERFTLSEISDMADLRDADNVLVIETRKKSPAPIMWLVSKDITETGEDKFDVMKFILTGVYTMSELKFTGNPLSNTQMMTVFTHDFDNSTGLRRARTILTKMFNTTKKSDSAPQGTTDYTDKIASFFILDNQIIARFYHIQKKTKETEKIVAERALKEQRLNQEQKEDEKLEEIEQNHKPDEDIVDPNIEAILASDQVPWYEVNEIGPRFTMHPRESDLDDNYVAPDDNRRGNRFIEPEEERK